MRIYNRKIKKKKKVSKGELNYYSMPIKQYLYFILVSLLLLYGVLITILWMRKNRNGYIIIDGMKTNEITKKDLLNHDNIHLVNFNAGDNLTIPSNIGEKAYAKIFCPTHDLINVSFTGFFNIVEHGEAGGNVGSYDMALPANNTFSYRSKDLTSQDNVKVELAGFELALYYDNSGVLNLYGIAFTVDNLNVS